MDTYTYTCIPLYSYIFRDVKISMYVFVGTYMYPYTYTYMLELTAAAPTTSSQPHTCMHTPDFQLPCPSVFFSSYWRLLGHLSGRLKMVPNRHFPGADGNWRKHSSSLLSPGWEMLRHDSYTGFQSLPSRSEPCSCTVRLAQ